MNPEQRTVTYLLLALLAGVAMVRFQTFATWIAIAACAVFCVPWGKDEE